MKTAWLTGVNFGLTSGVITTLGLIVGLNAGTGSRLAVIGGILTIAVADALSDALGIHMAEEARATQDHRHVWTATLATFLAKLVMALTFVVPVLLLPLPQAVAAGIAWGFLILAVLSWRMARDRGTSPWGPITEHLLIASLVVVATNLVGQFTARLFGG